MQIAALDIEGRNDMVLALPALNTYIIVMRLHFTLVFIATIAI